MESMLPWLLSLPKSNVIVLNHLNMEIECQRLFSIKKLQLETLSALLYIKFKKVHFDIALYLLKEKKLFSQ